MLASPARAYIVAGTPVATASTISGGRERGLRGGGGSRRAGAVGVEPLHPVGAHRLDDGQQVPALVGQLVLDARRDLGVRAALDDALLLERAQAQRERPRADAGQRALELAEPRAALGQIADQKQG